MMNLIHSSKGIRGGECWIPICLPGIAKDGFLYAYIYFIEKDIGKLIFDINKFSRNYIFKLKYRRRYFYETFIKKEKYIKNNER